MRGRIVGTSILLLLATALTASGAADAAAQKAVRMRTKRQLTQILSDLAIEVPEGADIYALREIALKQDAIPKWESKFPEKIKRPTPTSGGQRRGGAGAGAAGGGRGSPPDNMAEMLFPMLDKNNDGKAVAAGNIRQSEMADGQDGRRWLRSATIRAHRQEPRRVCRPARRRQVLCTNGCKTCEGKMRSDLPPAPETQPQ